MNRSLGQATLPSVVAAERYLDGSGGNLLGVIGSALGRAAIIASGMYIAGERKHVARNALAGSLAIEAFVLVYVGWQVKKERGSNRASSESQPIDTAGKAT